MANFVYNVAKGIIRQRILDGADVRLLLLKSAGADATLKDLDTIALVLADPSTDEADFTNYARIDLAGVAAAIDDANDSVNADANDASIADAGGAVNNSLSDVLIYEHVGVDSSNIPWIQADVSLTTNGGLLNIPMPTGGFWGSA